MARQIGPWPAQPLAAMLEWRLNELDARLRAIESRLPAATPAQAGQTDLRHLSTTAGRTLTVGRLAPRDITDPASSVFVDIGHCSGCGGGNGAGLTADEARGLAAMLVAQAAAVEEQTVNAGAAVLYVPEAAKGSAAMPHDSACES